MADYNKVGLLVMRDRRILLCRKKHSTSLLILPGGCLEAGETELACLERELREELGEVRVTGLDYIGRYTDRAAGAPGKTVAINLYSGDLAGTPTPHSEIAELVWFGEQDDRALLAPSLVNKILPDLIARGLLPWGVPGVELLAPARDIECGLAAIDCGADAVYIGAPRFGAREAAGNASRISRTSRDTRTSTGRGSTSPSTRCSATTNCRSRARLAWQLYETGIDGLIIQDVGLLEVRPAAAAAHRQHADAQPHARTRGVSGKGRLPPRHPGARAGPGADPGDPPRAPHIELECFVHGALCVCYSGQCYLSYALGGRSGNRGQCAQPCRKAYTLVDGEGRVIERNRHLLSLRDLNLSDHLPELLDAGVTSFKIEGRLKDRTYVTNVVAHYRARLDEALHAAGMRRSSSGISAAGFTPDPSKTFNRGYTTYFLHGRGAAVGSPETPKMVGEEIGRVTAVSRGEFTIEARAPLHAGDGLSFFDHDGRLCGTVVNAVRGSTVVPDKIEGIEPGTPIHRNHDHEFLTRLARSRPERRIRVEPGARGSARRRGSARGG